MKTEGLGKRQFELDRFARRKGWTRGPLKSWKAGRLTIAVGHRGYPKPNFVVTDGLTHESREVTTLEDVERLVDAVRVAGQMPAERS